MKNYGFRMKYFRSQSGLSQRKIAELLGISQSMYAKLETSTRNVPIDVAWQFCKIVGISMDTFCAERIEVEI